MSERLEAGSRMALAAFVHDLGKFAERAAMAVSQADLETHLQMYCPRHEKPGGSFWYSHRHAAYTALAVDRLEEIGLPPLKGWSMTPFADWKSREVDDSLVNAAARHHKPETFLQWIIATADRVASGFEREEFDRYNEAKDETPSEKNHYQARLLTLFEQVCLKDEPGTCDERFDYRYPLRPLSPDSLFPVLRKGYEPDSDEPAKREYAALWEGFLAALKSIPESHRQSLPLWLDHFDTLWQTYTHAIPSATAFNVKPEVPLYDHSKTAASLAVALWRYHSDLGHDFDHRLAGLKSREDWDEEKLLLIQGDFFGIQKFIFAGGGDTKKKAAKLMRGRSFYVSLITECAALKVLDELELPATSQIINAAGKFLLVAPNTDEIVRRLQAIQRSFDAWFLEHAYGEAGLGLAWEPASCNHFLRRKDEAHSFSALMTRLHRKLERAKYRHFDLCAADAAPAVFSGYLDSFRNDLGVCAVNDRAPAADDDGFSRLAADQIRAGSLLVKSNRQRLVLTREPLGGWGGVERLDLPIFGYHVHFTGDEAISGKFGAEVGSGNVRRMFDFSLPARDGAKALWNGYARRNIRGYVPVFEDREWDDPRYKEIQDNLKDEDPPEANDLKTLHHIACEDLDAVDDFRGVAALHTLKGDIDDLGAIFQQGVKEQSFAKMAALSRQVNNFFAVYLPWLCQNEYPNTYTVFAGGDDFFLIGPWKSQVELARKMRQRFGDYVAHNPVIHFSAGLAMTKPAVPIHYLADGAEDALDAAKQHQRERKPELGKDALTVFGQTIGWEDLDGLWSHYDWLHNMARDYERLSGGELATGYVYGLLALADMAATVHEKPENAVWHSRLAYRTYRMTERLKKLDKDQRKSLAGDLTTHIATGVTGF